ncbi:hypothetical protein HRbin30_00151 [bacterium HR30]|nr:hypothetical protein HRbin30_00151 [bacterium HR30]
MNKLYAHAFRARIRCEQAGPIAGNDRIGNLASSEELYPSTAVVRRPTLLDEHALSCQVEAVLAVASGATTKALEIADILFHGEAVRTARTPSPVVVCDRSRIQNSHPTASLVDPNTGASVSFDRTALNRDVRCSRDPNSTPVAVNIKTPQPHIVDPWPQEHALVVSRPNLKAFDDDVPHPFAQIESRKTLPRVRGLENGPRHGHQRNETLGVTTTRDNHAFSISARLHDHRVTWVDTVYSVLDGCPRTCGAA